MISPGVLEVLQTLRPDFELCPDCRCCELTWNSCESCGGVGFHESDDLEDSEWGETVSVCDWCDGEGRWKVCLGNCQQGQHQQQELVSC
jgi:hypothetical protein